MEARIRQLEALLRDAVVGVDASTDAVAPGVVVTLDLEGDVEEYLVGSREDRHPELTVLSVESPLGRAVLGAEVGAERTFETPAGASLRVRVTAIRLP